MATTSPTVRDRFTGYAALVRVPNLFTAPPDVVAGAALAITAGIAGRAVRPRDVAVLAVASMLLYAGGTSLNDWADAAGDAETRPERPIPSGIVPRRAALGVGLTALGGGVVLAATVGPVSVAVAGLLSIVVVGYDALLKGTSAGFLAMGTARGLNVLLGASVGGGEIRAALDGPGIDTTVGLVAVPAAVFGYIAAVTAMADDEGTGGSRRRILTVGAASLLAAVVVAGTLFTARPSALAIVVGLLALGVFLVRNGRTLRRAYADPVPEAVVPAVGTCVVGESILVGSAAAAAGVGWALTALSFLVPATVLSKRFDVS
ncbi:4-hydroxybenzoate polyprenyltransferase [Halorubrum sp. 48-1-W]|uniref:UbiA family prenyltransferase n=1 Tax=Halorubrum sp. 48-1-W TaxID=2249761 RepID=UPI000DCE9F5B|nr:UbiA family prenyltransferase [Halorubrum sp. 48-1-W]RAW46464.1 4-hydroxybenzoate polyprenyltransferase [Halorubrum sp. 48-1-W]